MKKQKKGKDCIRNEKKEKRESEVETEGWKSKRKKEKSKKRQASDNTLQSLQQRGDAEGEEWAILEGVR